jgi:hypothetical protein
MSATSSLFMRQCAVVVRQCTVVGSRARFEAQADLLHAAAQSTCVARGDSNALEQWTQGCETAGDDASAALNGGPSAYLDGDPEEVVEFCETIYVAHAYDGTDHAPV